MLASHMLNGGEHVTSIYSTVRVHLPMLVDERRIEELTMSDGVTVYRLPEHTPMEAKKST